MPWRPKKKPVARKKTSLSSDALGWIACAVGFVAMIILNKGSDRGEWDAASWCTVFAFFGLLVWCREKWKSPQFWAFWLACLGLHVLVTWVVVGQLLPRLSVSEPLFVAPINSILGMLLGLIALIEPILLKVLFFAIEDGFARGMGRSMGS